MSLRRGGCNPILRTSPGSSALAVTLFEAITSCCHLAKRAASKAYDVMQFSGMGAEFLIASRRRLDSKLVLPKKSDQKPPVLPLVCRERSVNSTKFVGS